MRAVLLSALMLSPLMLSPLMLSLPATVLARHPVATTPQAGVEAAMQDSAAGWNTRDLDRFMAIYKDDPATSFVVKDGIVRGKPAIADRYRKDFAPDHADKHGTLSFEMLRFVPLDPTHALLIARFHLAFANAPEMTGPTSLVFEKTKDGWKIIADHSS